MMKANLNNDKISNATKIQSSNQTIGGDELKSSVKLFEHTSLFKSLSRVIFLAVIVSFVSGLYVFIDQVLMTKVLPLNITGFTENTLRQIGWFDIPKELLNNDLMKDYKDETSAITSIIRIANSANSPIVMLCTATSLYVGLGTSIPYSSALGSKNQNKIKEVWNNGFYNCIVISIITTLVFIGLLYVLIPAQINDNVPSDTPEQIKIFLTKKRNITIEYATNYSLYIVGFNILNNFVMFYVSLLNSEGKNSVPTIVVIIANCLNILFDYIFLYYVNLGMNGSAIATVISYVTSNLLFYAYLWVKNKTHDTFMLFKNLKFKGFKIDWSIIFWIFSIGSASFLRNASVSLYFFTQQTLYANITNPITGKDPNYYVDILGAVNPIYNLFFSAVIGIIRGARSVVSYNYGRKRNDNVLKAFWITNLVAFLYGSFFYIICCPVLLSGTYANGGLLWFFQITPNSFLYNDSVKILNITMSQLILFSLSISGMLYFQATSKPLNAIFTSLVNGVIVGIPVLLIMAAISKTTHDMNWYIYSPVVISCLSGIIVFGYSNWYIYLKKKKIYFER